jgi:putative DNA primase/helicase
MMSGAEISALYPIPNQSELMNTPDELRNRRQFVLWKLRKRRDKSGETKWDKVPHQPGGDFADTTDLMTWCSFEDALEALEEGKHGFRGIGFVFSSADPYTGIDLDDCRDPATGELEEWAKQIVRKLDGYSELSPSGKGVHIIVRGKVQKPRNTKRIEAYSAERFFTMTGRIL